MLMLLLEVLELLLMPGLRPTRQLLPELPTFPSLLLSVVVAL
jgi:hypothetical protein